MSETADIIVIGGGIAGISVAARLASGARVRVLEAEPHLAYHSTGRSAAIFVLNYGNTTLRALNAASVSDLSGDLLGESVLSARGEMLLAREEDLDHLETELSATTGTERLSVKEACALVPALRRDSFTAAIYEGSAQDIDVDRLFQGFARLLREKGGRIETGAAVRSIGRQGAGWRVETAKGGYEAAVIVNAAGAWADGIAEMAGVSPVGLQPLRRSAVIMPVPADVAYRDWPMIGSITEDWYAKPESTGLMISPADEDPVEPQDAWPDDMVLAEGLDRFSRMVDLPLVRPSHAWAGLRSFVADRSPVCGFDPGYDGFFWLAGQGGYGVQTAPALSGLAADLILGNRPALTDTVVSSLDPARLLQAS